MENLSEPCRAVHEQIKPCVDVERITARIALRSARPRDLSGLRDTLRQLPQLHRALHNNASRLVTELAAALLPAQELSALLQRTLRAEPSSVLREGGVIADGFDAELDELRGIQTNCGDFLLAAGNARTRAHRHRQTESRIQPRARFLHRSHASHNAANVPDDYRRRQTLKNAERYITPELKAFEDKALSANDRALAREKLLYEQLLDQLAPHIPQLQRIAAAIAELDVLATFAERAATLNFCAPQFSDDARAQHHAEAAIRWWKRRSSSSSPTTPRCTTRARCC